ncbi:WG repeat-containing protein [Spirosoma rhododendri]|uniref:WG repeat-containing protein n=1 Tax=Spirosoma rhododendri TaxID=2728024 RepID=A0A7L5DRB9_9BACT|nr:WG repeat-containing protein [Spirosoma rhododendri]QJD80675.1 WG repeat-containing protein [Spirosoma rhododendri]
MATLFSTVLAKPRPDFLKPYTYSKQLGTYYLVYQQRHCGLLDSVGRLIVACQFDDIDKFYDGMAEVVLNGKHGYVNQQGRLVVPMLYVRANPYHNGEALVVSTEGKFGYLNTKGQLVKPFSQLAHAYIIGNYVKSWVCQPYVKCFREGAGEFYIGSGGAVDYIPQHLSRGQTYREDGLTVLVSGSGKDRRYGFSDSVGHIVWPLVFEEADEITYAWKDWVRVRKYGRYGFLNRRSGKMMVPLIYEDSRPSALARIWVKRSEKWGMVDRTGKTVIPFQYTAVSTYCENRALVRAGTRLGYVDTTGKLITPIQFDKASYFKDGRAKVYQGNKWFEINSQGRVIDSGIQMDVFWTWVRYGGLFTGILFFVICVCRYRIALIK